MVSSAKYGHSEVSERIMELEIEREEQQKALVLLKELRRKEKEELESRLN